MIEDVVLRWVVTAVLFAIGAAHLPEVFRRGAAMIRFDAFTHAAMSVSMAAMAWPWHNEFAVWPQVVFFAGAAAWFTAHSFVIVLDGDVPTRVAWVPAAHASAMYAMVWMLVTMTLPAHHHHHTAEPSAASAPALILGGAMLVVTAWWATKACRLLASPKRRRHAWSPASHTLVHAVMALMLLEVS